MLNNVPLDKGWRDYARELPDARAKRSLNEKKHMLLGWMEECFCANCGCSGGMISKDWAAHVFYLCNDCVDKHGGIPAPELPEFLLRGSSH